jgi:AraC-like DNA-binding protein
MQTALVTHRSWTNGDEAVLERPAGQSRARLLDTPVGLVEDVRRQNVDPRTDPQGFCHVFQVCLPYRGLFVWHVNGEDVVGDPNQVVFVRSGESFRMSGPIADGYAELIITPDLEILSEIAHVNGVPLGDHPLFKRRICVAHPRLQRDRTRFLHWVEGGVNGDGLQAEEMMVGLVRSALQHNGRRDASGGARALRLIRRTKEYLEAELSNRILLSDIGRAAGASPAYLTDLFRRVEGMPLHRYLTRLRLARALAELPRTDDLTRLALDVGFSSHSHFSAAFRRVYGCTPSELRQMTRRARRAAENC